MRIRGIFWLAVMTGGAALAADPHAEMKDCPMHKEHTASQEHFAGVTERGNEVMGFAHDKSGHHFGLTPQGGFILAEATDPNDTTTRNAIRDHFHHIAHAFAAGDFAMPNLIHAKSPPGVGTMKKLKGSIDYRVEQTGRGGRIVISTGNPRALKAIHHFLRFQIEDHRTGDSLEVAAAGS